MYILNLKVSGYKVKGNDSLSGTAVRSGSTFHLILLLLNTTCPVLAKSVDPDQLASEWLLIWICTVVIKYVNFY